MIEKWFGTPVYTSKLEPSKDVYDNMLKYAEECSKVHVEKYAPRVVSTRMGDYKQHNNSVFEWLTRQVSYHCKQYLISFGVDISNVNLYASKAWLLFQNQHTANSVPKHTHLTSCLSVVYYLKSDPKCGGNTVLFNSNSLVTQSDFLFTPSKHTLDKCQYRPYENNILIFPSRMPHGTSNYEFSGKERVTVVYDIEVTAKTNDDFRTFESMGHMRLDPSDWKKL